MGKDEQGYPTWRKGVRYHQVSTDEVYGSLGAEGYFTEETRFVRTAVQRFENQCRHGSHGLIHVTHYQMPVTITRCSNNSALSFSRKTDSADYQEYTRRQTSACLR